MKNILKEKSDKFLGVDYEYEDGFEDENTDFSKSDGLFDVYISYSTADAHIAKSFCDVLRSSGISVKFGLENTASGNLQEEVAKAISKSKIFVPLISENSLKSKLFEMELLLAESVAESRAKIICPVLLSGEMKSLNQTPIGNILMQYQIKKGRTPAEIKEAAEGIAYLLSRNSDGRLLFDKYSEYKKAGLENEATKVLFDIIDMHCEKISDCAEDSDAMLLFSYTEELAGICNFDYSDEGVKLAMRASNTMGSIVDVARKDVLMKNLIQVSVAIRILGIVREIDRVTLDIITGGMVMNDRLDMSQPFNEYKMLQERYAKKYYELKESNFSGCSESELEFIEKSMGYYHGDIRVKQGIKEPKANVADDLLQSVAKFMNEGNKILDIIGTEKPARDFLKCVITSYERLKAYSEVVGAKEICAECIEKITELKQRLTRANAQNSPDERAESGIKSLLGLVVPKSGAYDVFISHKKEDFDLALDMYDFLKANLKEGFFDKYSLPEMSKSDYRKAIMQALDGSKHFVVILSKLEYLESYWVSLEMEVFQAEIDEGRKRNSNFLMVVTNNVYDEIMNSNKEVIPIDYRRCEIIKFADYKNILLNYLN